MQDHAPFPFPRFSAAYLQTWGMRHLPRHIDDIGGPVDGLVAIVTGPTRCAEMELYKCRRGAPPVGTAAHDCHMRDLAGARACVHAPATNSPSIHGHACASDA